MKQSEQYEPPSEKRREGGGKSKVAWWAALGGALLLLLSALYVLPAGRLPYAREQSGVQAIRGWQCDRAEVSLPARMSARECLRLETVLPPAFAQAQTVFFWTCSANAEVRLDGALLYRLDASACGGLEKAAPSQWNELRLPVGCAGKRLELTLHYPYALSAGYVQPVYYGPEGGVYQWMDAAYGLNAILNGCIFFAGVVIIGTALLTEKSHSPFRRRKLYLGLFAVLLSLWLRWGTVGAPLYALHPCLRERLANLVFLVMFIPLAAYVRCRMEGAWKRLFGVMILAFFLCDLVILLLQYTRLADIRESLYAVLFLVGLFVVLIFVFCIRCFVAFPSAPGFSLLDAVGVETIVMVMILEVVNYFSVTGVANMGVWMRSGMLPYVTCEGVYEIYRGRKRRMAMQRIESENDRLRLQLLLGQIKPHFIYNALGAIRELIHEDPNAAYTALYDFSRYLRQHIETYDAMSLIGFSMELEHIRTYAALEKVRFGAMLEVCYDIGYTDFEIPPLSVQPFVENAIKHGVFHMENGGTVWLRTWREQDAACIEVRDNGTGFDVEAVLGRAESDACGIKNAMQRLRELGGAECGIRSAPGETVVSIRVPLDGRAHGRQGAESRA